ncbi:MAG TPA: VenA family class IV lanthipeptide [Pseudonocardiaceae bacterium]|nr:VenA family class IV lanthipeptide [Pseudonocardiaceae bacterium]
MELANFDLVASLQALPETDPIEIEGIQFGGTCQCIGLLTLLNSVCIGISCT